MDCNNNYSVHTPYFAFAIILKVLGTIMTSICSILTLFLPLIGIAGVFIGVLELLWSEHLKKKGVQQAIEENDK